MTYLLSLRVAREYEIGQYRNLAYNVCDQHGIENLYPHATANVETRGEAVFAVQNAIDGVTANCSHGEWSYESWGINRQEDARMRLDFGREVEMTMEKSEKPYEILFDVKRVTWVEMHDMIKSGESSPFPALTQIECMVEKEDDNII